MNDKVKKNIRVIRASAMKMSEGPLVNKYAHGKTAETTAISKVTKDGTLADVVLTALYHIPAFDEASAVKMEQLVSAMREVQEACGCNKKLDTRYDLCNRLANHGWLDRTDDKRWFFIKSAQNKIAGGGMENENGSNEASPQSAPSREGFSLPPQKTPEANDLQSPEDRVPTTIYRILRDTELSRRIKYEHGYKCQVCNHTIQLPDGSYYAEAHHIKPLGIPHNGPDISGNILCLCPNHHAELDYGVAAISLSALRLIDSHAIDQKYVEYHNSHIYKPRSGGSGRTYAKSVAGSIILE
ncbi:MAG: HNH endonuclease [Candidatus Brocadiaceae bacterium]|uniref:HNH endonuclease n=1 Tax=Candidatus Wunengus sp. YC61 TaxID=3367698 RepID=UPI0027256E13|nr:HNH endonuclease [Candidatus Brocadiaceae bacterium]